MGSDDGFCVKTITDLTDWEYPYHIFQENRKRLADNLDKLGHNRSMVLLQGGKHINFYDTDLKYPFRQESFFMWTFGVMEPGCSGGLHVKTGQAYLFIPRVSTLYAILKGQAPDLEAVSKKYKIPNVYFKEDIGWILKKVDFNKLLILSGKNSDSGLPVMEADFGGINDFNLDKETLLPVMINLRLKKTWYEMEALRYAMDVSAGAHRHVMRFVKPGRVEYECESELLHHCYSKGGCKFTSYPPDCVAGTNTATLYYGDTSTPNPHVLHYSDLCIIDAGVCHLGYSANMACTFPVSGKFTPGRKFIYESVLASQNAVLNALKPGINWKNMHLLANETLLACLKAGGLLRGEVSEMMKAGIAGVFQPHGLGHFLGLDNFDVGGYTEDSPPRPTEKTSVRFLRTARNMEEGMVITVGPGCYFIDHLLDEALHDENTSKFFVPELIKKFRGFGGIRIKEAVYINANGCDKLVRLPRTVEEIENWMAGRDNDKYDDTKSSKLSSDYTAANE